MAIFLLMVSVNTFFLVQMHAKNRRLQGFANDVTLKREYQTLAIIIWFFAFGYLLKFIWDEIVVVGIAVGRY